MKILKYLLLLLLLSFVSFFVFIATKKEHFIIEKSKIIHTTKSNLYNYVNDYQNLEDFMDFMVKDATMKAHFSKTTIGIGAKCIWEGIEGLGIIQTLTVKENDSITQKMYWNGSKFNTTWIFKDTLGGTKVTIKSKGEMSFSYKIYTALNGGSNKIIGSLFENSLINLDKNLDYEINTYSINEDGIVTKLGTPYLKQSFTSKINTVAKNARIVIPKIINFCKHNKIELNGKPFVIYHTYDDKIGLAKISICVPIKEAIMTSNGSDISSDQLDAFQAIKVTLKGDYSHNKEALAKSKSYLNRNVITPDFRFSHIEVFTISKLNSKNPSKWKTEIYLPIKPKNAASKVRPTTEEITNPDTEANLSEI